MQRGQKVPNSDLSRWVAKQSFGEACDPIITSLTALQAHALTAFEKR